MTSIHPAPWSLRLCNSLMLGLLLPVICSGADVLSFHVPDRNFQGVDAPNWVLDGALKVFLPLEDANSIDEVAKLGVTVIHSGGPSPYYPLVRDDPNSGLPARERAAYKAGIAHAKSHGMRVILGVFPMAPIPMVRQHLDWIVRPSDDDAILKKIDSDLTRPENWDVRTLGLDSPYGDYIIECLAEIVRDLQIDGVSFDGNYHPLINHARYAKEQYRKDTGRDIPKAIDLNSIDYRLYLLWIDGRLEAWYRKLHQRLRRDNPEAAVYTWTTNAGRYGHFLMCPRVMSARMNRLFDCPVQEWWLDEVNLGASVVPLFGAAYIRAVAGGRVGASEPYIISRGNPQCSESFPKHELISRCLSAMANGGFTPLSLQAGKEATYETLRQIALRKPWIVRTEREPWAAVLISEQTREFYAYRHVMDHFLAHCLGVFRTAYEERFPLTLITDGDIRADRLAPYRVLILPNVACLSDDQVRTIREYVAAGGSVVATCETSLFDEIGRPRHDFALGDLFGVSYRGRPKAPDKRVLDDPNAPIVVDDPYWAQRSGIAAFRWGAGDLTTLDLVDDPVLRGLAPNVQVTFKGPLVRITDPQAPMKRAVIMFPDAGAEHMPAAAAGTYQKGRVVYLAAGIDAAHFSYGFPYTRRLLANAIRWAARQPYPVDVRAPMCVQSTFFRQKDTQGTRIIVHLFNGINSTSDHGLPEVDVPLREECVPIAGIQARLRGLSIKSIHLEPGGTTLKTQSEGDALRVDLPPLNIHAMLVVELNG